MNSEEKDQQSVDAIVVNEESPSSEEPKVEIVSPEEQESEVPPAVPEVVSPARPQLPWELVSDGTSVDQIQILTEGDGGKLLGDPDLLKKIDNFLKQEKK